MAARYWVGGTATWDGTAGSKWALTSGGAGGQAVPTSADTVFFNAASGANTITLGISPTVISITMTGFTGTFDGVGSLYTITLNGTGTIWNGAGTIINSPNITLSDTSTTARVIQGGGKTYGTLTIGGTTGISQTSIGGLNTFNTIASTKTVAHTVAFIADQTINNWLITGTSGNIVSVIAYSAGTTATLSITNQTSGIDYLDVTGITANLAPVTFYAGANTILRSNVQGVAAIASTTNQYVYVLNSGTSFATPANWNNSNNEIHLFAGGGGGAGSIGGQAGGGGGGGGGYTKATNVTLTGSISYAIGAGGNGGTANGGTGGTGGSTTFNSGTYTTAGGVGGSTTATPTSVGGTGGVGSTFNGGTGGIGGVGAGTSGNGGGGGGGAGGPLGIGKNGGNGFSATGSSSFIAGGGGGGNGGGTAGGNATSATGGTGGNNNAGVGGGASNTTGFSGGGGGGGTNASIGINGSCGVDIAKAGMGSGSGAGGGANGNTSNTISGLFGGGAIGGGTSIGGVNYAGAVGAQGGIIIVYNTGSAPLINNAYFLMFA